MGIKNLNKYLRNNCPNSIKSIHLSDLSGKTISIDVSIYLYKYEAENTLLENMYLLLSILRNYNIIPIFIFDGKTPIEKKSLIQKRYEDRASAEKEYNCLKEKLNETISEVDKQDIMETINKVKKKIIYMTKDKICKVKELIIAYGATFIDALGEADELCVMLVIQKKVWACLSEDMDMFVYGCTRVIRYISLLNHNAVLYYMKGILNELNLTPIEFREICVVSGTDYNIDDKKNVNLFNTIKYFTKYKYCLTKESNKNIPNKLTFYNWLKDNTDYIVDFILLEKINKMFDLNNSLLACDNIKITNGQINLDDLKNILHKDGFIFV
jgi:5'-3' exonuclease